MAVEERFQDLDNIIEKMSSTTEKELIKAYSVSLKNILAEIQIVYNKYSSDGTLSYSDMVKYNRIKALEDTIKQELITLTGKNANVLKTSLEEIFSKTYYYSAFILETEYQTKLAYTLLNPDVIKASIQNPISGLTLNDRLIKNRQVIVDNIRQGITQGLIQGHSYQKMASSIKTILENDAVKAKRVVQTEAHRVREESKQQSYEKAAKMGIEFEKVWISTMDSRTRSDHKKLDGLIADKGGYFHIGRFKTKSPGNFGVASEDINCRCTTITRLKGIDESNDVRRAKDEDGKSKIIPYTTYEDFYKNRIVNSN